jgi:hypothetical protein
MLELAHIDPDAPPIAKAVVPPLTPSLSTVAAPPPPAPPAVAPDDAAVAPEPASWWRSAVDKLLR